MNKLDQKGQPGLGDAFLKWVLTNQANPGKVEKIPVTPEQDADGNESYEEFPTIIRHCRHSTLLTAYLSLWRQFITKTRRYFRRLTANGWDYGMRHCNKQESLWNIFARMNYSRYSITNSPDLEFRVSNIVPPYIFG